MLRNRKNVHYLFVMIACTAGYVWLFFQLWSEESSAVGVCMFKHATGIPCPSCGATRSVLSILDGKVLEALYWNPIGFIVMSIMIACPLWICFDWITHRETFYKFYIAAEKRLRQKKVAIPLVLLIVSNWIWNIYKDV
ncbi:DUF2752 domain-containing protein [Pseudochryseolinea flava]|uniref:DUF2752 domain-containing protein n=1 Tax=Pseudochryseolinea flava TaxID=2059302 RepID=A0A364Y0N9_9BACT|nr:DUF2752 domain-containing protein [Pseudochryseolinea flava]RAW00259.1 DUF2752 domain-containing protein [Pseudochryseolinea flava]